MQYILMIFRTQKNEPTPFDGQFIVEYDPTRAADNPLGLPMRVHLVCSPDRAKARRFPTWVSARDYWSQESGLPYPANKPLTAYNVLIEETQC